MLIRALVVDDEPPARARLRQLLGEANDIVVVGEAANIDDARAAISTSRPDVVFLDIEMPQGRGTTLAASLPEPRPFIVFATAFEHYAIDAFALAATDYLLKPLTRARLSATLARVRQRLSGQSDLEREVAVASATQTHLLPRTLTIPGFDYAALTTPARGVGGDFYVVQPLRGRSFGLALGDVSGKGVPAGLVASSVQARLEATARHADWTAADIVAEVNRGLAATTDASRFATLVYLELDAEEARVTVVNAGHPPLIIVTPDAGVALVSSSGPALGVLPDATFTASVHALPVGSVIVAYSDGVTEASGADHDEFGETRLIEAVQRHADQRAGQLCETLQQMVHAFQCGAPASDDISLMVLKRAGQLTPPGTGTSPPR